jgi:GNAT superfamily N-acetyltransferase
VSGPYVIEPLAGHDRRAFSCGVVALDRYFQQQVTQDIRRRMSNCFVATDAAGAVAAFYTFSATGLPIGELTDDEVRRLPRYPLLPAGLIGRLAVSGRHRGQGLGAALIVDAIERAARAEPAIFALIVDAKDETAERFYGHLGFRPFVSHQGRLFLPVAAASLLLAGRAD